MTCPTNMAAVCHLEPRGGIRPHLELQDFFLGIYPLGTRLHSQRSPHSELHLSALCESQSIHEIIYKKC